MARIELKINDEKFVYSFDLLTVEQVECAREIGEWKLHQIETEAKDFNQILRSKSAEYLPLLCSFIFSRVVNGKPQAYDQDERLRIEQSIKQAPASILPKLKEAVRDFFTNLGSKQTALMLLQGQAEKLFQKELLKILASLTESKGVLSNNGKGSKSVTKKAKSKRD